MNEKRARKTNKENGKQSNGRENEEQMMQRMRVGLRFPAGEK
jgi:hypothetical protein